MTENEAREAIKLEGGLELTGNPARLVAFFEGLEVADRALEEVQQYPKLGTPEDLKETTKYLRLVKKHGTVGKTIEACAEYEEIGTIEECREAMDRQNPKKPITVETDAMTTKYICPACSCLVGWATGPFPDLRYCSICGQKLDME